MMDKKKNIFIGIAALFTAIIALLATLGFIKMADNKNEMETETETGIEVSTEEDVSLEIESHSEVISTISMNNVIATTPFVEGAFENEVAAPLGDEFVAEDAADNIEKEVFVATDDRTITMFVTGYTAEEGFDEGSATATGSGCYPGVCAMNTAQMSDLGISYGDTIYVEGLGTYTVLDCGCDYGIVDIWTYTNAEAYAFTGYYDVTF